MARVVRRAVRTSSTERRAKRQLTADQPFILTLFVALAAVGLAFDPRLQVQFTLPKLVAFYFGTAAVLLVWGWRLQRGQGSRFYFSLPLTLATAPHTSTPADEGLSIDARLAPGVELTALVADDNIINRRVLASCYQRLRPVYEVFVLTGTISGITAPPAMACFD